MDYGAMTLEYAEVTNEMRDLQRRQDTRRHGDGDA